MFSETIVSAFLEASITGAGLVFAVFALITPLSRKIFREKAERQEKIRVFPEYFNFGLLSAFFFFAATVFNCGAWFVNIDNRTSAFEPLISLNFFLAWASFFLVGIFTMFEISNVMRKESKDIRKKQKEEEKKAVKKTQAVK
jgi:hypothetical protein